jgi:hypothetical protein
VEISVQLKEQNAGIMHDAKKGQVKPCTIFILLLPGNEGKYRRDGSAGRRNEE